MRIPLPPAPLPDEVVALAREYAEGRREPAAPRDAATVLLLREGPRGPEIYYLRRRTSMAFAAGMGVYPGGGVDPRDSDVDPTSWAGPTAAAWAARLGCAEDRARALVCAAVRETFEESGVLLAGPSPTEVVQDTTGPDWEADRAALESHELALSTFLARRGLVLRGDLLGPWGAWTTPAFEPRRYRTWFFVARLPPGQRTRDVSTESAQVVWLPAAEAAAQAESDDPDALVLMPPTYLTSLEVAQYADPDAVLAAARDRTLTMHTPEVEAQAAGPGGHVLSVPDHHRGLVAGRRR